MTTFAERLADAIDHAKTSRKALAKALKSPGSVNGVSEQAIGQLLAGTSKSMSAQNTARAARFLGVDLYWFCTGEGQKVRREPAGLANLSDVLDAFGEHLAAVHASARGEVGKTLAEWATAGGGGHWRVSLLALLAQRQPPKVSATLAAQEDGSAVRRREGAVHPAKGSGSSSQRPGDKPTQKQALKS